MHTLYRYFLVLAAGAALLAGVQAPNFADQYEQRLDAHLSEAAANLRGYQDIADRYFGGSLAALLAKHEQSADAVFHAEAKPLRELYARYRRFNAEKQALATGIAGRLWFIATRGDRTLTAETWAGYSFTVPLNATAVTAGFIIMGGTVLLIELLRMGLRRVFTVARSSPRPTH
jgi:hypothetical protein